MDTEPVAGECGYSRRIRDLTMSKLHDEIKTIKQNGIDFKEHLDDNAPNWLKDGWEVISLHPATPYFFLGMGIEALTIHTGIIFNMPLSPGIDAIFSLSMFALFAWYQNRGGDVKPTKD